MAANDPRTDRIAQEAARLIESGQVDSIGEGVRQAMENFGWTHVPQPSEGQVRRHAQGMAMQALGAEGYRESIVNVWRVAEGIMTTLEEARPRLIGRAVRGQIDAGVTLYVRIFSDRRIGEVVHTLVDAGYDEPEFETLDSSRLGRFDRIRFEEEGLEVVITRVPAHRRELADVDLMTNRKTASVDLETLRAMIARGHA